MTAILPQDILVYAGGDAWARYGTYTRRVARIGRNGESGKETVSRPDAATCATYVGRDGLVHRAAANVLRGHWIDTNGDGVVDTLVSLHEPTRTNVALWSRDLTNAAWVKTNCTAALNQTGADGAANAASSLTASAGNATCLQSVTLASSARFQSCQVKRLTGTGTINMTTDGGLTWTPITVTSAWAVVTIPTQTLANPQFGFQIVTNGDAIAVDFVQNENGTYRTRVIPTTTTAVTRADDLVSVPIGFAPQALTAYVKLYEAGAIADTTERVVYELGTLTNAGPRLFLDNDSGSGKYRSAYNNGSSGNAAVAAAAPSLGQLTELRAVLNADGSTYLGQSIAGAAEAVTATSPPLALAAAWNAQDLLIGCTKSTGPGAPLQLQRLLIVKGVHTLAELQAVA